MKQIKNFGLWIAVSFFVLIALGAMQSIAGVIAIILALLIAPVEKYQIFIHRHINGKLKTILVVLLTVVMLVTLPEADQTGNVETQNTEPSFTESTTNPPTDISTEPPTNPPTNPPTEPPEEPQTTPPTNPPTELPVKSSFSIHFIDVGQADAALIECDGHYMLIDGGNKADSNVIYSVLKKADVKKLDIVVGTHAHEDHIGGLPGAFQYASADITLCPVKNYESNAFKDFVKYADQKGGGITVPKVGNTYSLGSATVTILGVNGGSDTNDTSIVMRIDYGKTSFVFTGDAERAAEQAILNSNTNLKATVLKVGHHGSDTSTTYPFLREIMPDYAVISVGKDNAYGHPTDDTLSRLRDADVKVFRTDLQGDIHCKSDGTNVTFTVERNANADTLKPPVTTPEPTDPPHTHSYSPATCTEPQTCSCGATKGKANGHSYSNGKCIACGKKDPNYTQETMVWIPTNGGKKYHSKASCSNMIDPKKVTQSEAESLGFTPCKKCQ